MNNLIITFEGARKTLEKFVNSEWMERTLYFNTKHFMKDGVPKPVLENCLSVTKDTLLRNYLTILGATAYLSSLEKPKSPVAVTNLVIHVMDDYYDVTVKKLQDADSPIVLADMLLRVQQYGMFELLKWLEFDSYEYDTVIFEGFEDCYPTSEKED